MIQIFILHWAGEKYRKPIQFTLNAIDSVMRNTEGDYELIVVDNYSHPDAFDEFMGLVPTGVRVIKNDRPSRSLSSGHNKVWSLVESDYFIFLHSDSLATKGYSSSFLENVQWAEKSFGRPAIVSPRYIWYPFDPPKDEADACCLGVGTMSVLKTNLAQVCSQYGIPFKDDMVFCPPGASLTDDGHSIIIFATSKKLIETVGEWDEGFLYRDYDDADMGIRVIMSGCKNLVSQSTFIHHVQGSTYLPQIRIGSLMDDSILRSSCYSQGHFIEKWGMDVWNKFFNGAIWPELHKAEFELKRKTSEKQE